LHESTKDDEREWSLNILERQSIIYWISGGSRGGARGPLPLILGKKEEITEGRKAGRASKTKFYFVHYKEALCFHILSLRTFLGLKG